MNLLYESTRNKDVTLRASEAILKGLSDDGGLFVLRNLDDLSIDINTLLDKDYYGIAKEVLAIFLDDFTQEEVDACVENAYRNKFSTEKVTPLKVLSDGCVLELFNGPTSAFKDVGLQMLPQLTKTALNKTEKKEDILILTATSGDTGKAALEGFKDVDRTKIIVFYPNDGVSKVQEAQMIKQEGKNTSVCAINGNFDDAQTGIKNIFVDDAFKAELKKQNITLSSANSINVGRLVPQMVYYFDAYVQLVSKGKINVGDKVNFIVPTGNFGNILAGYYAKQIGLPVNQLICASNENNVLYDFLTTGVYDRNRPFLKTISPSMDILISSNLERLLYYVSGCDNAYVNGLMKDLSSTGKYEVSKEVFAKIKEVFACGYTSNEQTGKVIKEVYEKDGYLLDPHTAVAYNVLLNNKDEEHVNVVLSTASPYKFTNAVYEALYNETHDDEFALMDKLNEKTGVSVPVNLASLKDKPVLHNNLINKDEMKDFVMKKVGELK